MDLRKRYLEVEESMARSLTINDKAKAKLLSEENQIMFADLHHRAGTEV
jgi:hypothetical protein